MQHDRLDGEEALATKNEGVADQISWDITTKEKGLFENALDRLNLSCQEPLLDESGEFLYTEMPDMAAEPPNLEGEANPPVSDDDDPPVSESQVAEDEDPNEGERQVEHSDLVTEEFRDIERDHLRRRLTSKQSRRMQRLLELSLVKPLDPKTSNGMA